MHVWAFIAIYCVVACRPLPPCFGDFACKLGILFAFFLWMCLVCQCLWAPLLFHCFVHLWRDFEKSEPCVVIVVARKSWPASSQVLSKGDVAPETCWVPWFLPFSETESGVCLWLAAQWMWFCFWRICRGWMIEYSSQIMGGFTGCHQILARSNLWLWVG